uniref:Candidate secreted effector n=1 Tax=Meloidogyne incognita TaxID=6306 RepID=A0A914L9Y7_MELIC
MWDTPETARSKTARQKRRDRNDAGQNGASPKRRKSKTAHGQNGAKISHNGIARRVIVHM